MADAERIALSHGVCQLCEKLPSCVPACFLPGWLLAPGAAFPSLCQDGCAGQGSERTLCSLRAFTFSPVFTEKPAATTMVFPLYLISFSGLLLRFSVLLLSLVC